jgi:hypothetical protein
MVTRHASPHLSQFLEGVDGERGKGKERGVGSHITFLSPFLPQRQSDDTNTSRVPIPISYCQSIVLLFFPFFLHRPLFTLIGVSRSRIVNRRFVKHETACPVLSWVSQTRVDHCDVPVFCMSNSQTFSQRPDISSL